jgi:hypothetical protein
LDNVGPSARHPDFHYVFQRVQSALQARLKAIRQMIPGLPPFSINDGSLEWGGLFDISETTSLRMPAGTYANWIPPHCGHRDGYSVDVRWKDIPPNYRTRVYKLLQSRGMPPRYWLRPGFAFVQGHEGRRPDHYHLDFVFN